MSRLYPTRDIGTGNRYVSYSRDRLVELNNTPITPELAREFTDKAPELRVVKPVVEFSARITYRRWGSAWPGRARIVLYRHSVMVFLHELGHIVAPSNAGHGPKFGRVTTGLFERWDQLMPKLSAATPATFSTTFDILDPWTWPVSMLPPQEVALQKPKPEFMPVVILPPTKKKTPLEIILED